MEKLYTFGDEGGKRYAVPKSELDEFRQHVPNAFEIGSFNDTKGNAYATPYQEMEAFMEKVPDAMTSYQFRSQSGKDYSVPYNEMGDFYKALRTDPDFEDDRKEIERRVQEQASKRESVIANVFKGAAIGAGEGLLDAGRGVSRAFTTRIPGMLYKSLAVLGGKDATKFGRLMGDIARDIDDRAEDRKWEQPTIEGWASIGPGAFESVISNLLPAIATGGASHAVMPFLYGFSSAFDVHEAAIESGLWSNEEAIVLAAGAGALEGGVEYLSTLWGAGRQAKEIGKAMTGKQLSKNAREVLQDLFWDTVGEAGQEFVQEGVGYQYESLAERGDFGYAQSLEAGALGAGQGFMAALIQGGPSSVAASVDTARTGRTGRTYAPGTSPVELAAWTLQDPARALALSEIENPSRKDFEKAGLPRVSAEERTRIASDLRELAAETKGEPTGPLPMPGKSLITDDGKVFGPDEAVPPGTYQIKGESVIVGEGDHTGKSILEGIENPPPEQTIKPEKPKKKGKTKKAESEEKLTKQANDALAEPVAPVVEGKKATVFYVANSGIGEDINIDGWTVVGLEEDAVKAPDGQTYDRAKLKSPDGKRLAWTDDRDLVEQARDIAFEAEQDAKAAKKKAAAPEPEAKPESPPEQKPVETQSEAKPEVKPKPQGLAERVLADPATDLTQESDQALEAAITAIQEQAGKIADDNDPQVVAIEKGIDALDTELASRRDSTPKAETLQERSQRQLEAINKLSGQVDQQVAAGVITAAEGRKKLNDALYRFELGNNNITFAPESDTGWVTSIRQAQDGSGDTVINFEGHTKRGHQETFSITAKPGDTITQRQYNGALNRANQETIQRRKAGKQTETTSPVETPKPQAVKASDFASMSDDDFDKMAEQAAEEIKAEKKVDAPKSPAPKIGRKNVKKAAPPAPAPEGDIKIVEPRTGRTETIKVAPPKIGGKENSGGKRVPRAIIASAAKHGVQGIESAAQGLYELFGANKRLGMGLTFDEDTYAKAKPHFQDAIKRFSEAGAEVIEVFKWALNEFGEEILPYLKRFKNELAEGKGNGDNNTDRGQNHDDNSESDQKTGTPKADADVGEGASEAGGTTPAVPGREPGLPATGEGSDGNVRPTQSTAGDGVSGDGVSAPTGAVEGQPATDSGSRDVPSGGDHGVVPAPIGKRSDGPGGIAPVDGPDSVRGRNIDLRGKPPIRLTRGQRRAINDQARAILNKPIGEITEGDREVLRQYTGEGGLKSGEIEALTQHYTDYPTIAAIFRALENAGVPLNQLLEPAVGAGNFVGHQPGAKWTTVDIDETNHKVASVLYPKANHYLTSFENFTADGFDAIISNVPFLETRMNRNAARPDIKALHDFYFVHALDLVRDDGVVAFVTSTGTMDKLDQSVRSEIVSKADVIGAFRLPSGHFTANAHTDVTTDIIFLQKRPTNVSARPDSKARNDLFVKSSKTSDDIALNEWYQAHPEAVLGDLVAGKNKLYGGRPAYEVHGQARLDDIAIDYRPYGKSGNEQIKGKKVAPIAAPTNSKEFATWAAKENAVVRYSDHSRYRENIELRDGVVYAAQQEVAFSDVSQKAKVFVPVTGDNASKIRALDAIRQYAAAFQSGEGDNAAVAGMEAIAAYKEEFKVAPHKDKALKSFFSKHDEQIFFSELTAQFDEDFTPAEVFTTRTKYTGSGRITVTKDDDLRTQAVAAEDNRGIIRFPTSQGFVTEGDVGDLLEAGYALAGFEGDSPVIQNDILYYSGNIYQKLEALDAMRESAPAQYTAAIDKQVAQLQEIMPAPRSIEDININGAESWLEPFLAQIGINVKSKINEKGIRRFEVFWNAFSRDEAEIFKRHLNGQSLITREDNESTWSYMNRLRDAEEALRDAVARIKSAIGDDASIRAQVEHAFNSRFRSYVKPDYNKASYLIQDVLDEIASNSPMIRDAKTGKMKPLELRQNQIAWVVQALYEGRGINAHDVGGGKTIAGVVLARALNRRGRAMKPLFVVPAKTIKNWGRTAKLLFPDAKIVDLGNLAKGRREKALFDVANSNADYTLISHEGFEKIKLPVETEIKYVQDAANEHVDDPEAKGRQKALIQVRVNEYIKTLQNDGRDTRQTWDKLGFDCVIADEAHAFKNIGINNQLVRYGLGTAFGFNNKTIKSARAYDFRFKANYIADANNGGNVFMLTATPTPNKPMEIYTMLRHLGRDVFDDYGIKNDRDFARSFFMLGTVNDPQTGRMKSILRAIVNAQELRGILNRYVDKLSMEEMPWITVPDVKTDRVVIDQSDGYALVAEDLIKRQRELSPTPESGDDTLVAIYTGGRSGSVDPRLYGGAHAGTTVDVRSFDSSDDKVQWTIEHVDKVAKANKSAGQLIFVDDSGHSRVEEGKLAENLHAEMKRELVERGMLPTEIAIINGKEITNPLTGKEVGAGTKADEKKIAIQDAYNAGKIRVLIGSTTSMGEGMDLQVKTTNIYHLDIPYTPGAIRQRNGRGVRPGNENDTVTVHYLLMRGSFDSLSLGIVMTKTGWNEAIWDKATADTISTEEEMTAGAIPSQKQILMELERDPVRRKQMEVEFRLEAMRNQLTSLRNEHYSLDSRQKNRERRLESLLRLREERSDHLDTLTPNENIKDETKRAEQFETSKRHAQKMLEITNRNIRNEQAAIAETATKLNEVAEQIKLLHQEIKEFTERWYDEKGTSKVTESDVSDDQDADDGIQGFAGRREDSRPERKISGRRQDGAEVTAQPTQPTAVVDAIRKLWPGLSVRSRATWTQKKNPGWYVAALGEMRLKNAGDIVVAVHELGHHFDRELGRWSNKTGLESGIPGELIALGRELYGDKKPAGGYRAEGFAEFIGRYLTGDDIQAKAPKLYNWFTTDYLVNNPKEAAKIRQLETVVAQFQLQTPEMAIKAFMSPRRQDWSGQRIAAAMAGIEGKWIDALMPLLRGMQETGANVMNVGDDPGQIRADNHPFMLATHFARTAGGRTAATMLRNSVDLFGIPNGKSWAEVFAPIENRTQEEQFWEYLVCKRAVTRYHDHGLEVGISREDAQAIIDKYQSPQFDQMVEEFTDLAHRALHLLVESGDITMDLYNQILELNPIFAPMMRQFLPSEKRQGGKNKGKGLHKVKGGTLPIEHPLVAFVMQVERLHQRAMQTYFLRSLVQFYDQHKGKVDYMGQFMSEVPAPKEAVSFTLDKIKKTVASKALELGADPDAVSAAMMETWDELTTIYRPSKTYKGTDNIVALEFDGKRRFFEVRPNLLPIIEAITQSKFLQGDIGKIFRQATNLQRLGATGLNPAFGLIRNLLRDAGTAAVLSDYHFHVPVLSTLQGMIMDVIGTDYANLYHSAGLDIAGFYGQQRQAKRLGKQAMAKTKIGQMAAAGPMDVIMDVLGRTEIGPRLMEFRGAYKDAKAQGMSDSSAMVMAGCASKDVTVNFSRAGSTGRQVNEVVLFANANIQSADKLARALGARQAMPWSKIKNVEGTVGGELNARLKSAGRTTARALAWVTVGALMNYLRNRDKEWWKELPPYEKWNYVHLELPGGKIMRIPLPFEIGALFGAVPIALLEESRTPGSFKEAVKVAIENQMPFDFGVTEGDFRHGIAAVVRNVSLFSPAADILINEDWKGSTIVPRYLEGLDEDLQFKHDTTHPSKWIGKQLGIAPAQVEHILNGYTGNLYGRTQKAMMIAIGKGDIDIKDKSTLPIIGTLFLKPNTTKLTNDFYTRFDELEKRVKSDRADSDEVAELKAMRKVNGQLSKRWRARREALSAGGVEGKRAAEEVVAEIHDLIRFHNERWKE